MRTVLVLALLACSPVTVSAQNTAANVIARINQEIDELQYQIDGFDGITDNTVTHKNSRFTERATAAYITQINELQKEINEADEKYIPTRNKLRDLRRRLKPIDRNNLFESYNLDKLEIAYYSQKGLRPQYVASRLEKNVQLAIDYFDIYKNQPYAYQIIKSVADNDPERFMRNIEMFEQSPYVTKVIDDLVALDPIKMKRWVNTNTPMNAILYRSTNSVTRNFLNVFNIHGRASKAYYMLDDITCGKMTAAEADLTGSELTTFNKKLIELSKKDNIIAERSVHEKLRENALRIIRPINDLHENYNEAVRFKSAEDLSAEELYSYMVYTQDEIFTSTFNGFYKRFKKKLAQKDSYEFLQEMNMNRYRTFIKMCAGYSVLPDFLSKMSDQNQKLLMDRFVSNLEEGDTKESLTAAVDVADTFGSINDREMKDFFASKIKSELGRVTQYNNRHGIRIYKLLAVLLNTEKTYSDEWIAQLVNQYDIPRINELDHESLKNHDGIIVQQVFFFDDKDGEQSYKSFMPSFRNGNWKIEDKNTFVKMISTGKQKIEVYANKPQHEFEGKADLRKLFRATGKYPSVVIHRGHSFYVDTTINSLTPYAKLVVLGSCGGYHKLTNVIERTPDVRIISSKQTGTMSINDPMIRQLNNEMLNSRNIKWQSFWNKLGSKFKSNPATYKKFQDYVPPHKNLGAIFIMAYQRMKNLDES